MNTHAGNPQKSDSNGGHPSHFHFQSVGSVENVESVEIVRSVIIVENVGFVGSVMIVDSDIDDLEGDVVENFHFSRSFSSVSFIPTFSFLILQGLNPFPGERERP
ncbi:MAG: hypothetical protein JRJ70_13795 [Deltaproteobacteria bacterium]|nr:hypothetical protein [Deltaproteobacteria bacterium]